MTFRLIAPLYFKGKNYLKRTLGEGQDVYQDCVAYGRSLGINVKPIARCNDDRKAKEIFLDSILNAGGEGCFSGDNRVTMFDYSKKKISDIKEGDVVLSYNNSTHKVEPKKVTHVFDNGYRTNAEIGLVDHHLESQHQYRHTDKLMNKCVS